MKSDPKSLSIVLLFFVFIVDCLMTTKYIVCFNLSTNKFDQTKNHIGQFIIQLSR